jgi:hypothetical protein
LRRWTPFLEWSPHSRPECKNHRAARREGPRAPGIIRRHSAGARANASPASDCGTGGGKLATAVAGSTDLARSGLCWVIGEEEAGAAASKRSSRDAQGFFSGEGNVEVCCS